MYFYVVKNFITCQYNQSFDHLSSDLPPLNSLKEVSQTDHNRKYFAVMDKEQQAPVDSVRS